MYTELNSILNTTPDSFTKVRIQHFDAPSMVMCLVTLHTVIFRYITMLAVHAI